ncbi:MAG: signal peptidase II [Oscillospiraceae bacterium]|jgi:signal peptidase II|nr:signal peptidase II [Oscillospiraceae bacterium]
MKRTQSLLLCALIAGAVLLDQIAKAVLVRALPLGECTRAFLGIRLHHTRNTGVAFSFLQAHPQILTVLIALILLGCVLYLFLGTRKFALSQRVCLALIIGGGLGNLVDRIRLGFVVDFIEPTFVRFAVFNSADTVLTCAVAALAFLVIREALREKKAGSAQ